MKTIKYIKQNKELSENILQDIKSLKILFPDPNIELANNGKTNWLSYFNYQTVNAFELQKAAREIEELTYYDYKKFNAVLELEKPSNLNTMIYLINNLDKYILVSEFDVYHDDEKLGHTFEHHLNQNSSGKRDWKKIGLSARETYQQVQTKQGWLFKLEEPEFGIHKDELATVSRSPHEYEFNVKVYDKEKAKHVYLQLPTTKERILTELAILNVNEDAEFDFHPYTESKTRNVVFYEDIRHLVDESQLMDVNAFATKMETLSFHEIRILYGIMETIDMSDISELNYIIDNINFFELYDHDTFHPLEYAKGKLRETFFEDDVAFENLIDKYFDLEKYYNDLQSQETLTKTQEGILKINEHFEPLLKQELKM